MGDAYHQIIGRYALFDEIASGGMATVHIGRLIGPVGFSRTVAIKRLHPQFAKDPEFVSMFVDEARLAARIRHPNVVPTLDVVKTEQELFLVMDYVQGDSLSRLLRRARRTGTPLRVPLVVPIVAGLLHGLHAAHIAKGERGEALGIVHRDVSPQNVLVGTDGVTRVFDFGIAKARVRLQTTREGQIKGKLAYMAPEQLSGGDVGPQADIYAAAVVLWEALTNRRLFDADNEAHLLGMVLEGAKDPPSRFNPGVPPELDEITMCGLAHSPARRYETARQMARALEGTVECASASEIGEWVEELATETLEKRALRIAEIESQSEIKVLAPEIAEMPTASSSRLRHESGELATPSSQLSSISVAGHMPREKSGRGATVAIALAALIIGGGGVAMLMRNDPAAPASPGPPVERAELDPTSQHLEPVASQAATPSQQAVGPAAVGSSPTSSVSAAPSATLPGPVPVPGPRMQPPPRPHESSAPPPPPPPKKCAWKKVFDSEGNHTYKEVCE